MAGFFANFNASIQYYGAILESVNTESFIIASEWSTIDNQAMYWVPTISSLRRVFSGKIGVQRAFLGFYSNALSWESSLDFVSWTIWLPTAPDQTTPVSKREWVNYEMRWFRHLQKLQSSASVPYWILFSVPSSTQYIFTVPYLEGSGTFNPKLQATVYWWFLELLREQGSWLSYVFLGSIRQDPPQCVPMGDIQLSPAENVIRTLIPILKNSVVPRGSVSTMPSCSTALVPNSQSKKKAEKKNYERGL